MTTTAHEDQFTIGTQTIEPVRQPYDTVAILRRNIADMEVALRTQTELKEKAEAELKEIQGWLITTANNPLPYILGNQYWTKEGELVRFVAVHSAGKDHETMSDEQGVHRYTRRDFGRVTGSCHEYSDSRNTPPLYAAPVPAPDVPAQVPEEWIKVMAELTDDLQAACDAEHPHRDKYPSVMRRYNNDMEIVEKARALLQSAEVRHD